MVHATSRALAILPVPSYLLAHGQQEADAAHKAQRLRQYSRRGQEPQEAPGRRSEPDAQRSADFVL